MSLAIDAIILFSGIFIIWFGTSRGFVRSIMGLISTAASLLCAYAFTPKLAAFINSRFISERITSGLDETLKSLALDTTTDLYNLDRLAEDLPEPFTSILERYNISVSSFCDKIKGITGCGENTIHGIAEDIAAPTSNALSSGIAFLLLFIGSFIALSILTIIIDSVFNMPVLKPANMFLGFTVGVIEAFLFGIALSVVFSVIVSTLGAINPSWFGEGVIEKTYICSTLLKINILDIIRNVLV